MRVFATGEDFLFGDKEPRLMPERGKVPKKVLVVRRKRADRTYYSDVLTGVFWGSNGNKKNY